MSQRPADYADRERAIHERERNVIVDAGAGTGKTTLLIARLIQLVAPNDDGRAFPLDRIAAITFTRKAAGELKLRLREKLLSELGKVDLTGVRRERLAAAVEVLDNAMICTVHSFADRLLRLRPVDAKLSPSYEIADDASALIDETFVKLLAAAKKNDARRQDPRWKEVIDTIRLFQSADFLTRTVQNDKRDQVGLDAFIRDMIETRDRDVSVPAYTPMDLEAVRRHVDELRRLVNDLTADTVGTRALFMMLDLAVRMSEARYDTEALRLANRLAEERRSLKNLRQGKHFPNDTDGWHVRRWIIDGRRPGEERPGGCLGDAILNPVFEYLVNRLVRMREVVLDLYKDVKSAHGVVDNIDLLIQLRDLLQRDLAARSFFQSKLDHILVDEFQDTDPLQAEIVLLLCEAQARAARAQEVELQRGKLTIVGDPKQSIYRFRRADIAMYAMVCAKLREQEICEARLRVNFRSSAKIIDWVNDGFDVVLGSESEDLFDLEEGTVKNVRLVATGRSGPDAEVHVLPFGQEEENLKAEYVRDLEGEALAHYFRYLVEDSELRITDPRSGEQRRPRYGDIAVMMISTPMVHHLTSELDRIGVPHVVRGGTLFMDDPLHRQFILGLRAIADAKDGVARAALMRPPFFAVSLEDLAHAKATDVRSEAFQAADTHVERLRRDRHTKPAGEIARRVLETTGFGRYVAASVNGAQRLARLYELCRALDDVARAQNLDFDGATALARDWLDDPPRIEAPLPVDADAVQVITVHQAKGLEWPIVALWDGWAAWNAFLPPTAFTVDPTTGEWALELYGLKHDPSELGLRGREVKLREAERKRVAYVAATRARDILIVPEAGDADANKIAGCLILSGRGKPHHRAVPYKRDSNGSAWWKSETPVSMRPVAPARGNLDASWRQAAEQAFAPYLRPAAVSVIAHAAREDVREADEVETLPVFARVGRFGPVFGTAVHRALELILKKKLDPNVAAAQAVREGVIEELLPSVLEDVGRAYAALEGAGLLRHELQTEYPVAGSVDKATLVSGIIDLLVAAPDGLCLIDFKTDAAPRGDVRAEYPGYVEQVHAYARVLGQTGVPGLQVTRTGLLFTADGGLRWV